MEVGRIPVHLEKPNSVFYLKKAYLHISMLSLNLTLFLEMIKMKDFETTRWPIVLFGEGKSLETGKRFSKWGVKNVLAVYGSTVYSNGLVDPILESIKAEGINVYSFVRIATEVPDYLIEDIAKAALTCSADGILAIGGGSTMDAVKYASAYMYSEMLPMSDYLYQAPVFNFPPSGRPKLIFIPTTAGSGAEMTSAGPVFNSKTQRKSLYKYFPPVPADLAILDPYLTLKLSPYLTITTAMDALAHAIESMTSQTRSIRSDMICGQAIELIANNLFTVMNDPADINARGAMLIAANLAIGVESKRHIGHAITEGLGSVYHIPHGHCCALALPPTLRYIAKVDELSQPLHLIAEKMNLPKTEFPGLTIAKEIELLNKKFEIALSLKELSIAYNEADISNCAAIIAADNPHLSMSVRPMNYAEAYQIMQEIYHGS